MKRILILVEGQTEETFVRDVLLPHLLQFGIALQYTIVKTKKVLDGPDYAGGLFNYNRFREDILSLLRDSDAVAVTMLMDFYGLPQNFPGRCTLPDGTPYERVRYVQDQIATDINNGRFVPFLALHEFEAYLFVEPSIVQEMFPDKNCENAIRAIKDEFSTPEEINDSPTTAPSKRLFGIFGNEYQKTLHGPLVTHDIGIERIRQACPHFNAWLTHLESLA